jgi:hypothetical protein
MKEYIIHKSSCWKNNLFHLHQQVTLVLDLYFIHLKITLDAEHIPIETKIVSWFIKWMSSAQIGLIHHLSRLITLIPLIKEIVFI